MKYISLEISKSKMMKKAHPPRSINRCRILHWTSLNPREFDRIVSYFTCDKFVFVSLMKNLLWNVRHIAAMMFLFEKFFVSMLCLALVSNPKSRILKIFSLFKQIGCVIEQDRMVSILLTQKSILALEYPHIFNSTYSGGLMNPQYSRD